ncbi:hypothetical protein Bca101_026298 [Brassica carinata]
MNQSELGGSPFGKLIEIGEKPSFSGRFGRFIISRQLKVEKKHEAWFIFAGKPVRFSLREFAYVTGLNCSKLPKHTKKRAKKIISEKPYWGELFGTLKEVPVTSVVKMLKKRTVTDREMRVKYALLALLAAVILPTTHTPRISQEHAERIKNIDDFFAYPWGRISFDMLMSSIKERKEVSLSQNTIALKGFVLSLQLVMVEAIPALTEVVNDGSSSGSEGDGGEEDDLADEDKNGKRTIIPGHARDTDAAGKVAVRSVIVEDKEHFKVSPDLCWSDDEEDPIVDNLMCLVQQRFPFNNSSFIGGVTMAEVNRMREEAKSEAINRKAVKPKQTKQTTPSEAIDCEAVASIVSDKVREDLSLMERQISSLSEAFLTFQTKVLDNFQLLLRQVEGPTDRTRDSSTPQHGNVSNAARDVQHPLIRRQTSNHVGIQTDYAENVIISEAIRFANQTTSANVDGLQDGQRMQSCPPTEGQTLHGRQDGMDSPNQLHCHDDTILHKPTTLVTDDRVNGDQVIQPEVPTEDQSMPDSDEEMDTDEPAHPLQLSNQANAIVVDVACNPPVSFVVDTPLDQEGNVSDTSQSSLLTNLDPALLFPKPTFAYVTGLNCSKLPKHTKKRAKKIISWGELFGTLKEVPVTSVVKMLKKRTVTDREMRVKYALLALLAAVILPTTHTPRISQEHAERIKNIDDFFAYPWGRISFDMLMSSIKERKEVSLSQNTIALKGFVLSLQLVMVEAIPALTEVVNDGSSSGSEGDGGEEDDLADEDKNGKRTIIPGHARDTDAAGKVAVRSVIVEDKEHFKVSPDLCWSDDEEDPIVDNLMCLVQQRFPFNNSSFIGGVTMAEVNRMREEAKSEAINRKAVKPKQTKQTTPSEAIDCEAVASIVSDKVREDLSQMERQISSLSEAFLTFQTKVLDNFQLLLRQVEGPTDRTRDSSTPQHGNVSNVVDTPLDQEGNVSDTSQSSLLTNLDPALLFPKPTFSLGLTQEERHHPEEKVTEGETMRENVRGSEICEQDDQVVGCRKSKRLKAIPKSLVGQYECDRRLLNRARVALVDPNNTGGNIDYSAKLSALLDKLKSPLSQFTLNSPANQSNHPVFLDTQFVSQLSKLFPKFSKCPKKDTFRFPSNILERFLSNPEAERFYFPFNLDKKHWVGVCVDSSSWSIVVMDCNIALRTDSMMVKEVSPIAQMLPYLLKQGGKQIVHKDARALPIERPRSIPQNTSPADSAVSAVLLLQAHAVAGVDVCKCITPEAIGSEVERLAVMFYEATVGML